MDTDLLRNSAPNTEKYMTGQIAATLHHEVQHVEKGEKDVELNT
jgi:hypothetical protein